MIKPAFFFALALLGNVRAKTLTFDVDQNKMFEKQFEAGFKITSAKLDEADFKECAKLPTGTKTDEECYTQSETSEVHFIIDDRNKYTEVHFMVNKQAKAKYTIEEDGSLLENNKLQREANGATGSPIEKTNFPLPFVPDAMQLILKATDGEPLETRQSAEPVEVTNPCTGAANAPATAKSNCFGVSKHLFPVTVKAKMESTKRILTLEGANKPTDTLEVTFQPKSSGGSTGGSGSSGNTGGSDSSTTSTAAWLSHSAALVLANLAMMNLVP